MTLLEEIVQRLAETKGDVSAQTAVAAEFVLASHPNSVREPLSAALDAAAVLRWFDTELLRKVLDVSYEEAANRFEALKALPFVERFRGPGADLRNVQTSTRLGWRKKLAKETPERFRALSRRAAACFADDLTPVGRIEWIYHLLSSDPERGATEVETLDRHWSNSARPEDRYALAAALGELETTGLVGGRARVWVLLVTAWTRVSRGESAQLGEAASETLRQARAAGDPRAEADAYCLLGDVLQAQGKLAEAQSAFEDDLTVSRRLVEQHPGHVGWQRDLAVAYCRLGSVLEARGKLREAHAAFSENLTIARRLAEQDTSNVGLQTELAIALSWAGGALKTQGRLPEAREAFSEYLTISRRLAKLDPGNAAWQRELAGACNAMGRVLQTQGELLEAQTAFEEYLTITRRLAEQDPRNVVRQRESAVAYNRLGGVLEELGKLPQAQAAFEEYLTIIRRLAEQDPSNAGCQRELAVAYNRLGGVLESQGKVAEAQAALGEDLTISRRLAEQDPSNAGWRADLAVACWRGANFERNRGRPAAALPLYEEASQIYSDLVEESPGFAQWNKDKESVESELARCRRSIEAGESN